MLLDEVAARLDHVAHQLGEDVVGLVDLLDLHLKQRAHVDVQRGFPELSRVHLAKTFIALQRDALARRIGDRFEQLRRTVDCVLSVFAPQLARAVVNLLQLRPVFVEFARIG